MQLPTSALPAVDHCTHLCKYTFATALPPCLFIKLISCWSEVLLVRSRRSISTTRAAPFHHHHPGCTCIGQAGTATCDPSLTRNQTSTSDLPRRPAVLRIILTEPPCEALIVGPPLLNPVLLVSYLIVSQRASKARLTGPKQRHRYFYTTPAQS